MLVDDDIDNYDKIVDLWGGYMMFQPIHDPDTYIKYRVHLVKQQLQIN